MLFLLSNRDYSDDELFKLKERAETFTIDCIKCATVGTMIGVLGIGIFKILEFLGFSQLLSINTVLVVFVLIYGGIVFFNRRNNSKSKEKLEKSKEKKISKEQIKEENIVVVKEELKKEEK